VDLAIDIEEMLVAFEQNLEEARSCYQNDRPVLAFGYLERCLQVAKLLKRHYHAIGEDEARNRWVRYERWVTNLEMVVRTESSSPSSRTRR
jgi:hypothetical protein